MKKTINLVLFMLLLILPLKVFAIADPALSTIEVAGTEKPNKAEVTAGKTTYNLALTGDYESVTINAVPANESYQVTGDVGEKEISTGINRFTIVVTDPSDNSSARYSLNISLSNTNTKNALDVATNEEVVAEETTTGETQQDVKSVDQANTEKNPKTGSFASYMIISLIVLVPALIIIARKRIYKL